MPYIDTCFLLSAIIGLLSNRVRSNLKISMVDSHQNATRSMQILLSGVLVPLIVSLVLLGIFSGLTAPPTMAWIGDCVPPKDRATGMGLFNLLGNFGMVLGPIVLGVILLQSNFVIAFVVAGLIELLSLLVVIIKS